MFQHVYCDEDGWTNVCFTSKSFQALNPNRSCLGFKKKRQTSCRCHLHSPTCLEALRATITVMKICCYMSSCDRLSRGAVHCIREETCFMLFQPHHTAHFQPVSFRELPVQRGRICLCKQGEEPVGGFGECARVK